MAFYLSGSECGVLSQGFAPADAAAARADVLDWLFRAEMALWPVAAGIVFAEAGVGGDGARGDPAALRKELRALDARLTDRTFLACDRFSVADVCAAVPLALLLKHAREGVAFLREFRSVRRWLDTVLRQPAVADVVKEAGLAVEVDTTTSTQGKALVFA